MEKKIEEMNMNPAPLTMDGGWEKQVDERAAAAKAADQRRISRAAQQKAAEIAERRIQLTMIALALALALIVAGAVYLNFVEDFPILPAACITVIGNSLLTFVLGWIFGRRSRR